MRPERTIVIFVISFGICAIDICDTTVNRRLRKELQKLAKDMPANVSIGLGVPENHLAISARESLRQEIARRVWRRRFAVAIGHGDPGSYLYELDRGGMMLRVILSFIQTPEESLQTIPSIAPQPDNLFDWAAIIAIRDVPSSPYNDGFFQLRISVPFEYPFRAPDVRFTTEIYHPLVSKTGDNNLNDHSISQWSPRWQIKTAVVAIRDMLTRQPDETDMLASVNVEAFELYSKDKTAFDKKAREFTRKYASCDKIDKNLTLPLP